MSIEAVTISLGIKSPIGGIGIYRLAEKLKSLPRIVLNSLNKWLKVQETFISYQKAI